MIVNAILRLNLRYNLIPYVKNIFGGQKTYTYITINPHGKYYTPSLTSYGDCEC